MQAEKVKLERKDYKAYFSRQREITRRSFKMNKGIYWFVLPYYLIFAVFYILPVVISIGLSFTYFNVLEAPRFINWQNYVNLFFADDVFLTAIKNTFLLAVLTGPAGYIMSFLFAWFINELPNKVRAILVVIFYAPTLSGQMYIIWSTFFSGDTYGYANAWLMEWGLITEPIQWLTNESYIMTVCIIVVLWMSMGTGFLSFVAGLQTVDRSMYEAGYMDGIKNRWQELWYVTLPSMKPQLMFGAVMTITSSFSIHDQLVPLVGFPSVNYAAHTIVSHLVDYGSIRFEMGYACAIATLLFLIMIACNKLFQALLRKVGT